MRNILACAALLATASAPAVEAAPPVTFFGEQKVPLLYHISHTTVGAGSIDRQVYVFRDGTVLMTVQGWNDDEPLPPSGGVLSGRAPEVQMKGLLDAFVAARVGIQEDCSLEPLDPSQDWHASFTWFGKGRRQNTFEVTDGPGAPCPQEIINLRNALQFVTNATNLTTLLAQ